MFTFLRQLIRPTGPRAELFAVYDRLVRQSRAPAFYEDWEVPDTLGGRMDLLLLHLCPLALRLQDRPEGAKQVKELLEILLEDLTRGLREQGVGDVGLRQQTKRLGEAFWGRKAAYARALSDPSDSELCEALDKNLYGACNPAAETVEILAAYTRAYWQGLKNINLDTLNATEWIFPAIPQRTQGETHEPEA